MRINCKWMTGTNRYLSIAILCVGLILLASGGYYAISHANNTTGTKLVETGEGIPDKPTLDQIESILSNERVSAEDRIAEALARIKMLRTQQREEPAQGGPGHDPFVMNDPFFSAPFGGVATDPFRELQMMQQRMDRMFDQAFGRMGGSRGPADGVNWSPQGEFEETEDAYIYRFDLPGVDKNSVSVTVEDNQMTVEGSRESKVEEDDGGQAIRREIFHGSFRRVLTIPPDVNVSAMKSEMKDGVLTVTLPKSGQPRSQKHQVPIL